MSQVLDIETTPNRIVLITSRGSRHDEAPANDGTISPGMLVERIAGGNVQKASTTGGNKEIIVAKEDALQGLTINDFYASGAIVMLHCASKSDMLYMYVAPGAAAIADGAKLMPDGAGGVVNAPANGNLYGTTTASSAITNTSAETTFSTGSYVIPANFLKVGDIIKFKGKVEVPSQNSTDTLNIKFKIGTTVISATGAVDVATNDEGYFEGTFTVTAVGSGGAIDASGFNSLGTPGTATAKIFSLASTTVDTTAAQTLTVTGTWSVANASDQAVLTQFTVELQGRSIAPLFQAAEALDNSAQTVSGFIRSRVI